ncbi:MAG: hypothetical protein JST20_10150, partial [Bacteroidetes bacterium]|nr:hypothetical protein [Bacteroidota bacterium]
MNQILLTSLLFPILSIPSLYAIESQQKSQLKLNQNSVNKEEIIYSANFLEKPPIFPGGAVALKTFIDSNLVRKLTKIDYEGYIILRFIIDTNGEVINFEVVGEEKDSFIYIECQKLLKQMPRWLPGKFNNHNVKSLYCLPLIIKKY